MGNYEIDYDVPYVRIKTGSNEYEYIVSTELYGAYSHAAARLFAMAYERGKSDLRRDLRRLLNV
jgi:hypothetical protein